MRHTLSTLEKNTSKFIREHSELSKKAENLKYKNYFEERNNYLTGQSGAFTHK